MTDIQISTYVCTFVDFFLKLGKWWNVCPTDSHRQTDQIRLVVIPLGSVLGARYWVGCFGGCECVFIGASIHSINCWICLFWNTHLEVSFVEVFCVPFTRSSETNQSLLGLSGFLSFRSRVKLNFILTVNYDKWTRWLFIYVKFAFLLLLVFEKFKTQFQEENSLERLFRKSTNDFVV